MVEKQKPFPKKIVQFAINFIVWFFACLLFIIYHKVKTNQDINSAVTNSDSSELASHIDSTLIWCLLAACALFFFITALTSFRFGGKKISPRIFSIINQSFSEAGSIFLNNGSFLVAVSYFDKNILFLIAGIVAWALWIFIDPSEEISKENESESTKNTDQNTIISNSKNTNTGINNGHIGDVNQGVKQRSITADDKKILASKIIEFSKKYSDRINKSHITIGFPGCKETTTLAQMLHEALIELGFNNIKTAILQTHGISGVKFDVSNAPDDSIMVQIFPPDNVLENT